MERFRIQWNLSEMFTFRPKTGGCFKQVNLQVVLLERWPLRQVTLYIICVKIMIKCLHVATVAKMVAPSTLQPSQGNMVISGCQDYLKPQSENEEII